MALFDTFGWYTTDAEFSSRVTPIPPEQVPSAKVHGEPYPNWTGVSWADLVFIDPTMQPEQPSATQTYHITKRAFWSRFPSTKETVMRAVRLGAPAGALMLVGALDRLNSRVESSPYVNLQDVETTGGLAWLASTQCPATVTLDGQAYPLRLTQVEVDAVLSLTISDAERYRP